MARPKKQDIITFKVDGALSDALRGIPNRSEFIRAAILSALDGTCPLCGGTGTLTCQQREHWTHFTESHKMQQCEECSAVHIVCEKDGAEDGHTQPSHRETDR